LKQMVKLQPTTAMPDAKSFASSTYVSPSPQPRLEVQRAAGNAAPLPITTGTWQTSTDDATPLVR
jgi:hypothetical protein